MSRKRHNTLADSSFRMGGMRWYHKVDSTGLGALLPSLLVGRADLSQKKQLARKGKWNEPSYRWNLVHGNDVKVSPIRVHLDTSHVIPQLNQKSSRLTCNQRWPDKPHAQLSGPSIEVNPSRWTMWLLRSPLGGEWPGKTQFWSTCSDGFHAWPDSRPT